jgi:hypothetical protein
MTSKSRNIQIITEAAYELCSIIQQRQPKADFLSAKFVDDIAQELSSKYNRPPEKIIYRAIELGRIDKERGSYNILKKP